MQKLERREATLKRAAEADAKAIADRNTEVAKLKVAVTTASETQMLNATLLKAVDTMRTAAASHSASMAELRGKNTTLTDANSVLRTDLSSANARIVTAAGEASTLKAAASANSKTIAGLWKREAELQKHETALADEVSKLKSTVSSDAATISGVRRLRWQARFRP